MREVGKKEEADDSDDECDGALKDEEPAPSGDTSDVAEAVEDTCSDQASEGGSEDVSSVENGDTSSDFFAGVKHGEQVNRAGVVGRFCDTEEETGKKKAGEIFREGCES